MKITAAKGQKLLYSIQDQRTGADITKAEIAAGKEGSITLEKGQALYIRPEDEEGEDA